MEAVHAALREAFKIAPGDRNVRLVVHEPHRFDCPPAREEPQVYTHISIDAFAGRTLDAKRNLYRAIVTNLELFGVPKDHVKIPSAGDPSRELGHSRWTGCLRCRSRLQGRRVATLIERRRGLPLWLGTFAARA